MRVHLKIKIKSLAAEARIIRLEEKRHRGSVRESLHNHRVCEVRREQRSSMLAYGFLRGRSLSALEGPRTRTKPNWTVVERLVKKYGGGDPRVLMQKFAEWRDAALPVAAAAE